MQGIIRRQDGRAGLGSTRAFDLGDIAAGLTHEQFIDVVKNTITDAEVCDWVRQNVKKTDAEKRAHSESMLNYPKADDAAMQERLKQRKEAAGLAHRADIRNFVDFIDADEKRS